MIQKINILCLILIICLCFNNVAKNQIAEKEVKITKTVEDTVAKKEIKSIKLKFHKINDRIEDTFIIVFHSVLKTFDLYEHQDIFIAQILLESKGYQFYPDGAKKGLVLTGTSGEKGISQILPSAALGIMKLISQEDKEKMINIGAKDFSYIKNKEEAKIWLCNTNNNIILYGYIMRYYMNYYKNNLKKSVVAYNTGQPYLKKYLDTGAIIEKHHYYKSINHMKQQIIN